MALRLRLIAPAALVLALGLGLGTSAGAESPYRPWQAGTNEELLSRLKALVDQAARARAADPRFLADLRALIRTYEWPWRSLVVRDDFADGDLTRDPAWSVAGEGFWVSRRGLESEVRVEPAATKQEQPKGDDLAAALLGAILERAIQKPQKAPATRPGEARISISRTFDPAFALEVALVSEAETGALAFAVAPGASGGVGYELVYRPGARRKLELWRRRGTGRELLAASENAPALEGGQSHRLVWTRDRDGAIRVTLDGRPAVEAYDRAAVRRFAALSVINRGGRYVLGAITLWQAGR